MHNLTLETFVCPWSWSWKFGCALLDQKVIKFRRISLVCLFTKNKVRLFVNPIVLTGVHFGVTLAHAKICFCEKLVGLKRCLLKKLSDGKFFAISKQFLPRIVFKNLTDGSLFTIVSWRLFDSWIDNWYNVSKGGLISFATTQPTLGHCYGDSMTQPLIKIAAYFHSTIDLLLKIIYLIFDAFRLDTSKLVN